MAIADNDPRMIEILELTKLALEAQDQMQTLTEQAARFAAAGDAMAALNIIINRFSPAIGERFRDAYKDSLDLSVRDDPKAAIRFQRAAARVTIDLLMNNMPMGEVLPHGLLRLADGDDPWQMRRAIPEPGMRRSSKPNRQDMVLMKENIVLRAYYDAGLYAEAATPLLLQYIGGGMDEAEPTNSWIEPVPQELRALALETGCRVRAGLELDANHADLEQRVLRLSPAEMFERYLQLGGTPR
jgi:hypothetical protein